MKNFMVLIFGLVAAAILYEVFKRSSGTVSALTDGTVYTGKTLPAGYTQPGVGVLAPSTGSGIGSLLSAMANALRVAPSATPSSSSQPTTISASQEYGSTIYTETPGFIGVQQPGLTLAVPAPTTVMVPDDLSLQAPVVSADPLQDPSLDLTAYGD